MHYRGITKDNIQISPLGFGCMRFPILDNDSGKIDEGKAIEMLRYAIDNGVNYIDTAYPYHKGNSEYLVGKALKDGYRQKVYLATKLPSWLMKTYEDFDRYLEEQLKKLDTEYIDFYLLHSLNKKHWEKLKELNVFEFLEKAQEVGKIKYIGFSFHDDLDVFKEIVDYYDWDFCQIQLNYVDRDYQAGLEGLKYAYEREISTIIMEPIKGGKLVNPSPEIKELWDENHIKRTPADWALRWVLNHKEVSLLLSGMSNLEQVKENISTVSDASPNHLSTKELDIIDKVTNIYEEKTKVGCTSCEYCLPCPEDVAIPEVFQIYNELSIFGTQESSRNMYKNYIEKEIDASRCIECGRCETLCPQNLEVIEYLKEAHEVLALVPSK